LGDYVGDFADALDGGIVDPPANPAGDGGSF
jgi:hypothetical protein